MKRGELKPGWNGMSDEILEEVAQWREEHPQATMREIEDEIDKRLLALRAKMISDTAKASERAKWEAAQGMQCPDCGAKLIKKGKKKWILLTRNGREIELDREYAVCPACGQGILQGDS